MSFPLLTPLYFLAGLCREFVVILYYKAIAKNKRFVVSGLAGGIEAYDWIVLVTLLKSNWTIEFIIAYTLGVTIGTYLAMGRE